MLRLRMRPSFRGSPSRDLSLAINYDFLASSLPSGLSISRASSATDIINGTLTSFSSGQARISAANGLLVEPQRTNLAIFNTSANQSGMTTFTQGVGDPLGGSAAFNCVEGSGSGNSQFNCTPTSIAFVSGTTYTVSAFIRVGTCDRIQMFLPSAVHATAYANFYLNGAGSVTQQAGTVRNGVTALGDSWYRIWFTFTATGSSTQTVIWQSIVTGTEARAAVVTRSSRTWRYYGPQVEAATSLSSYIPTTTATVTRASDIVTGTTAWVNASEGTIVARAKSNAVDTSSITDNVVWALQGAGGYQIKTDKTYGSIRGFVQNNYVSQASMINTWAVDTLATHGLAWKANDFAWKFDGQVLQTDGTGVIPAITDFRIGNSVAGTSSFDGYIHSLKGYTIRKTDAQLAVLVV